MNLVNSHKVVVVTVLTDLKLKLLLEVVLNYNPIFVSLLLSKLNSLFQGIKREKDILKKIFYFFLRLAIWV